MSQPTTEYLINLLQRAANELDAWCNARPDLAMDTPALIKEIEETIEELKTELENEGSNQRAETGQPGA